MAESVDVTNFFNDTNKHVKNLVAKKMRDSNTIKSNLANPYDRVLLIPRIHQLSFKSVFRDNFLDTERQEDVDKKKAVEHYVLKSLGRLQSIFTTESLFKVHFSGDITLITPWQKLKVERSIEFLDGSCYTFEEGHLKMIRLSYFFLQMGLTTMMKYLPGLRIKHWAIYS